MFYDSSQKYVFIENFSCNRFEGSVGCFNGQDLSLQPFGGKKTDSLKVDGNIMNQKFYWIKIFSELWRTKLVAIIAQLLINLFRYNQFESEQKFRSAVSWKLKSRIPFLHGYLFRTKEFQKSLTCVKINEIDIRFSSTWFDSNFIPRNSKKFEYSNFD